MEDQTDPVGRGPDEAARGRGSGTAALGRGGRRSRQRKRGAVLRRLRGADRARVSRGLGVTAATLSGWRGAFLAGGEAALSATPASGEELESERLQAKLGAALIERDLLHEKPAREDCPAGGQPPFGPQEARAMSQTVSPVGGGRHGVAGCAGSGALPARVFIAT